MADFARSHRPVQQDRAKPSAASKQRQGAEGQLSPNGIEEVQRLADASVRVRQLADLQRMADLSGRPSTPMQRKVTFPQSEDIFDLEKAIKSKKEVIRGIVPQEELEEEEGRAFDALFDELHGPIYAALARLRRSALDYGVFDLENPHALLLLYFEIKKSKGESVPNPHGSYSAKPGDEEAETQEREAEAYAKTLQDALPKGARFVETALLGAGASVAYYITANAPDPSKTLIIGTPQPWGGERGHSETGVVNHPSHMISPMRDDASPGDEALMGRAAFSDDIAKVLEDSGIRVERKTVSLVKKVSALAGEIGDVGAEGMKLYQIEADGATIYALNVVAGMGAGGENEVNSRGGASKDTLNATAKGNMQETDPLKNIDRVMTLNDFQNKAGALYAAIATAKKNYTVFVSGGNAAIDAVTRIITENEKRGGKLGGRLELIWAQGSRGAPFLEGTDNERTRDEHKDHLADLGGREAAFEDRTGEVKINDTKVIIPRAKHDNYEADFYIHGQGSDAENLKEKFHEESVRNNVAPTFDKNREFGTGMVPSVIGAHVTPHDETDRSSMRFIGATAETLHADNKGDGKEGLAIIAAHAETLIESYKKISELLGLGGVAPSELFTGLNLQDLMKSGGSLDGKYKSALSQLPAGEEPKYDFKGARVSPKQLRESCLGVVRFLERMQGAEELIPKGSRDDGTSLLQQFQQVVGTLPINVLANAQLTPSRSAVEAEANFVPRYVTQDVNFATDSRTVIAIHISAVYQNLDESAVNYWANRIVTARRVKHGKVSGEEPLADGLLGPIPNPYGKNRETGASFTRAFKSLLAKANREAD